MTTTLDDAAAPDVPPDQGDDEAPPRPPGPRRQPLGFGAANPEPDMPPAEFRRALDRLGWSLMYFAARYAVGRRTVSRWANGETPVPGPAAALLRKVLAERGLAGD